MPPTDWTGDSTGDCRTAAPGGRQRSGNAVVTVDLDAFRQARGSQLAFTARLLGATAAAPGQFGCFGLHEWAMVFQQDDTARRHQDWPLRLGQAGTDDVVREHQIRCTHFDAFRFFTPPARPLNGLQPDRESQTAVGAAGLPARVHGRLQMGLQADSGGAERPAAGRVRAREVDPGTGHARVAVRPDRAGLPARARSKPPAGKAEYVAAQREFGRQAQLLRRRLLDTVSTVLAASGS